MTQRLDILSVAHAPFTAINRRPYARLAKLGWSVEMAIPERLPDMSRLADPAGPHDPPIHWVRTAGHSNNRYWTFEGLLPLLEKLKPRAVILENEPESRIALQVGRWTRTHGAKLLLISNENDLPPVLPSLLAKRFKPALRTLRARTVTRMSARGVDHIFAICQDGVDAMERLGFRGRVSIMPLGFDPAVFHPDAQARTEVRAALGLTEPTIAYIGRMSPTKGIHILLDALEQLADLNWRFLIDDFFADPSAYPQQIKQQIEASPLLSARTVRFHADHVEVARYMNAADIVVVPSVWKEQYGRVAPEAMACGKVVVVAQAGALPELVGETGRVTPMGDVPALAACLRDLLTHPQTVEDLGRAAAERARTALTVDRQIELTDAVLRGLIGGPAAAVP